MVNLNKMTDPQSSSKIKQKALKALGVLLIVSGVYLLLDGAYQIADLSVTSTNNLQFMGTIEVLTGSILTWVGSASIAESSRHHLGSQSKRRKGNLLGKANGPTQECQMSMNLN